MNVLLINPLMQPSDWENDVSSKWPPLGIAYIAAVLENMGHQVKILERRILTGSRPRTPEIIAKIDYLTKKYVQEFSPKLVGITATTSLIMDAFHTAALIKKINPTAKVILGGCHPTAEPVLTLNSCNAVDAVARGEGEFVMLDIANESPFERIDGITYRMNGRIVTNKNRDIIEDLDEIPYPARHLLDRDFYFKSNSVIIRGFVGRGTAIFASRGCPYQCSFCQANQIVRANRGKIARFRSPENIIKEIIYLKDEYNIELLVFAEDIFSIQKERVMKVCDLLIEEKLNKQIKFAVNLRVDTVDQQLLEKLKEAGCVRVIYGCESGSQATLNRMNKKTTVEKNIKAVCLTKAEKLSCEVNMIIGTPDETKKDFLETLNFLKKIKPDMINRAKLNPLPGTTYFDQLLAKNIIERSYNWNEIVDRYVFSDFTFANMSPSQFRNLKDQMDREIVLPVNYFFKFKTNWKKHPFIAVKQLFFLVSHCLVLYYPISIRNFARKAANKLHLKSRHIFK